MKNQPKIAVLGCGDWGRNIARTLQEMGSLGALSDPAPTPAAQAFAQDHGLEFKSLEQIFQAPHIDGVCIATPTMLHFDLAKQALQSGKHVLVEKPLVYTMDEAKTLIALAEKQNLTLMVGYLLLYHPAFQCLQNWVKTGKLGTIRHVISRRSNFGKFRTDENVIWDLAPHDLSMVFSLYGTSPTHVSVQQATETTPDLSDIGTLHLEFGHGQCADIFLSRMHPLKEQAIYVIGTKGMAVFDDVQPWPQKLSFDPRTAQYDHGRVALSDGQKHYETFIQGNPLKNELTHFVECTEGKTKCLSSAKGTLDILKILCEIDTKPIDL
jgi:UDP-2-acetamido-3-amino-2,3-dideoxy-glucuronate N-acetyltransferase